MAKELVQKDEFDESLDMMMQSMFMVIFLLVLIPVLPLAQTAQRYFESQLYEGQSDSRILSATGEAQHIVLANPWIGAYFINDGPDSVELRINDENSQLFPLNPEETLTFSRSGAENRIYAIYYQCRSGETATLRIFGLY